VWLSGPNVWTNWKTISGAVNLSLTDEDQAAIAEVSKIPAEYPAWMIELWSQLRRTQLAKLQTVMIYPVRPFSSRSELGRRTRRS
jgi:hypothetical protein